LGRSDSSGQTNRPPVSVPPARGIGSVWVAHRAGSLPCGNCAGVSSVASDRGRCLVRRTLIALCAASCILALVMLPVVGCGGTTTTSAEVNVLGAEVFTSFCSTCHGLRGIGGSGPDLGAITNKDRARVESQTKNGAGPMPGFKDKLTEAQLSAVVDYVMQLKQ
jgi:cytochrome c5